MTEAVIAWISAVFLSTFFYTGILELGDYTARAPQRPGGHLGRTAGQLASGEPLRDNAVPLVWQMLSLVPGWIVLLGVSWFAAGLMGHERGWKIGRERNDVLQGIAVGVLLQIPTMAIVQSIIQLVIGDFEPSGRALTLIDSINSPQALILLVLGVAVGAPIVEELFYRGIIQRALIDRLGGVAGWLLASIIFGAVHLSLIEFFPLTVAGLGFGWLAWRTGRLLPAIIAHVTFNSFTVAVLLANAAAANS